jgi:pimeloyl-ACP methyl ester carboxylesterase
MYLDYQDKSLSRRLGLFSWNNDISVVCYDWFMKQPERVLYIAGIGGLPEVQDTLAELWEPYGLSVEYEPLDWTAIDYEQRLVIIGERIIELSEHDRVSLVGASGGGKPVLSLLSRHPDYVHRAVTISSKVNPYDIGSGTRHAYPNLVLSSDILPDELNQITAEMRKRVLCVHPLIDEIVAPEDAVLEGANQHTVRADGHVAGIAHALTVDSNVIIDFIQQD